MGNQASKFWIRHPFRTGAVERKYVPKPHHTPSVVSVGEEERKSEGYVREIYGKYEMEMKIRGGEIDRYRDREGERER